MAPLTNPAIPLGSKILITGVNGLIASHVADQALEHGYKVRGTVRSIQKNRWMLEYFEKKFGGGLFELVEVVDITKEGAFDEVLRGVSGVAHVASVVNWDPNPANVIPLVVNSTLNILKSAANTEGVKRFVLTSSATAAIAPKPNDTSIVTKNSWNEETVQLAQDLPADMSDMDKGFIVYGASKVKGEQAAWKWVEDNKPGMVFNTVLPGGNFGTVLSVKNQGFPSTTMFANALLNNDEDFIKTFIKDYPPEWFVDVQDTARLHIAALTNRAVVNERVFAYAAPYNWNIVLQAFRDIFPQRKFMSDVPDIWDDLTVIEDKDRAEGLLREMGRTGFTGIRESLELMASST